MNAHIVHGGDPAPGAVLVFHQTAGKARALAWRAVDWLEEAADFQFINLRSSVTREPRLLALHTAKGPQVIECPPVCRNCEFWGAELRGRLRKGQISELCGFCVDDDL